MNIGARRGLMSATIVCAALALVCGVACGSFYLARWIANSAPATHAPDWFPWAIAIALLALLMRDNDRTVSLSSEDRTALRNIAGALNDRAAFSYENRTSLQRIALALEVIADELRRRA